jgi:hypothetical protein
MTSSYDEKEFNNKKITYKLPLFIVELNFKKDTVKGGEEHKEDVVDGGFYKPHHKPHHNPHHKYSVPNNLQHLIMTKRITLHSTLNQISDFAPVIYRFMIKNSSEITMNNIKNLLSSYLKEVDIDYDIAIKKNITVNTDWSQLYDSLLI